MNIENDNENKKDSQKQIKSSIFLIDSILNNDNKKEESNSIVMEKENEKIFKNQPPVSFFQPPWFLSQPNKINPFLFQHQHQIFSTNIQRINNNSNNVDCGNREKNNTHLPPLNNNLTYQIQGSSYFTRPKKKRSRAAFSHSQVLELERRFNFQRYLSGMFSFRNTLFMYRL
jgi:hypothetical protein